MKSTKLILFIIACLWSIDSSAELIDGISYNLTDSGAVVISGGSYSGDVVIPEKIEYSGRQYYVIAIGTQAFRRCYSLTSIQMPNTIKFVHSEAFEFDSSLHYVQLSTNLHSIGSQAFKDCTSLESINIPNSITDIQNGAFEGCSKLKEVKLSTSLKTIPTVCFYKCTSLINIEIPNSVTNIANSAFEACSNLTSIIIPNAVTSIGHKAFANCKLTFVTIPCSVINIDKGAFSNCALLEKVVVKAETPPSLSGEIFPNNCFVIVPYGSYKSYIQTAYWKDMNIKEEFAADEQADGFGYIDLGLPSGLLWATCNLGAKAPEESGNYYAWGELFPKETYTLTNYKWYWGGSLKKYKTDNELYNDCDWKTELDLEDDAAFVNIGERWRIPSINDWVELKSFCTWEKYSVNGISGYKVSGGNGASIFLPAAGYERETIEGVGNSGWYQSRDLCVVDNDEARAINFNTSRGSIILSHGGDACMWRKDGVTIRPIYIKEIKASSISLNITSTTIPYGGVIEIKASFTPDNTSNKNISWKSSNTNVATVQDGFVLAKRTGIATITATTTDGTNISASCQVTVDKRNQTISWSQFLGDIQYGGQMIELIATSTSGLKVKYKSNDESIATIFNLDDKVYLNPVNCGKTSVIAYQEGDGEYYSANEITKEVNVVDTRIVSPTNSKTLVAYYSQSTLIDGIVAELANQIAGSGNLVYTQKIEPINNRINEANTNKEVRDSVMNVIGCFPNDLNSYPSINGISVNINEYDDVIMVYPLWNSEMAAPMQTFSFMNKDILRGKSFAYIEYDLFGDAGSSSNIKTLRLNTSNIDDKSDIIREWLNSEATGILQFRAGKDKLPDGIYDLQGRRISKISERGVNIINGKKIVR